MHILPIITLVAVFVLMPTMASAQGNSMHPDAGRPDNPGLETANSGPANPVGSENAGRPGSGQGSNSASGNAAAGGPGPVQSTQDRATQAVRTGQAVPLDRVLRPALEQTGGSLIDTQLFVVDGFLLYELKILLPDGMLDTLYYYARTGNPVR